MAIDFIFGSGMKLFLAIFPAALIFLVLFASRQKEQRGAQVQGQTRERIRSYTSLSDRAGKERKCFKYCLIALHSSVLVR